MFLLSVVFFVVGIIVTVFGYASLGMSLEQQLPMKVNKILIVFEQFLLFIFI